MNEEIKAILARPEFERLRDWVAIGPVQKAVLMDFIDEITYKDGEAYATGYDEGWEEAKALYTYEEEYDK